MWEIFAALDNKTSDPFMPMVEKKQDNYETAGLAVFSGPRMTGELDMKETETAALIKEVPFGFLTMPLGNKQDLVSFRDITARTKITPSIDNKGLLTFRVRTDVTGEISETNPRKTEVTLKDKKALETKAAQLIKKDIDNLLLKLQGFNSDPLGFGEKFRVAYPQTWEKINWHEVYPAARFDVDTKLQLNKQVCTDKVAKAVGLKKQAVFELLAILFPYPAASQRSQQLFPEVRAVFLPHVQHFPHILPFSTPVGRAGIVDYRKFQPLNDFQYRFFFHIYHWSYQGDIRPVKVGFRLKGLDPAFKGHTEQQGFQYIIQVVTQGHFIAAKVFGNVMKSTPAKFGTEGAGVGLLPGLKNDWAYFRFFDMIGNTQFTAKTDQGRKVAAPAHVQGNGCYFKVNGRKFSPLIHQPDKGGAVFTTR